MYGGRDNLTITVGIRYGNEASQYMSPYLSREIADQFDLDPLNREAQRKIQTRKTSHDIPSLHDALKNTVCWEDIVGPVKGYGEDTQEDEES